MAASITTVVRIDSHLLADFKDFYQGTNRVDRPREFMAKSQEAFLLARKWSLNNRIFILLLYLRINAKILEDYKVIAVDCLE